MTLKADMLTDIDDVFLDEDDFAVSAVWTDAEEEEYTISGIFDAPSQQVNPATGLVETTAPQFETAVASVSGIARGDTLVIDGTTYYVLNHQPDGAGMTTIILSEDAP
ncbi:hypothetical protein ES708_01513 [subsurface metagenome]